MGVGVLRRYSAIALIILASAGVTAFAQEAESPTPEVEEAPLPALRATLDLRTGLEAETNPRLRRESRGVSFESVTDLGFLITTENRSSSLSFGLDTALRWEAPADLQVELSAQQQDKSDQPECANTYDGCVRQFSSGFRQRSDRRRDCHG